VVDGFELRDRTVGDGLYAGSLSIEALGAFSSISAELSTELERVPEGGSLGTTDEEGAGESGGPSTTEDEVPLSGLRGARSDSSTTVEPPASPQLVQGRPSDAEGPRKTGRID
jgi:hypothetical protein